MAEQVGGIEGAQGAVADLAKEHADQLFDVKNLSRLEQTIANAIQTALVNAIGAVIASAGGIGMMIGKVVEGGEKIVAPVLAPMLSSMLESALGVEVSPAVLARVNDAAARKEVGRALGTTVLATLENEGGALTASKAPAEKLIGMLAHLAIDTWAEGTIVEWLVSLFGTLHELQGLSELGRDVVQATGIDELGRIGLRPLANVTVATPLTWHANKTYRPSLLAPAAVLRQFTRGRWDWADVEEELAKQGWSSERIDALLNEQRKFASVADVQTLLYRGEWTKDRALRELQEQGYDEDAAQRELRVEGIKRIAALENAQASAILTAYAQHDIDRVTFEQMIDAAVSPAPERALLKLQGETRARLNTARIAPAQVVACVKAGILNVVDYRRALERAGYPSDDVVALELLLRHEMDAQRSIEEHRAALEKERAAEKATRDADRAARAAHVEAENALHRRGSISDLRAAVVRGVIPISRLEEVLAPSFDSDTIQIYVAMVEDDRQTYLEQQRRADEARQRAAQKGLSYGQVETAVLEGVLTVDQYRDRLRHDGMAAADVDVLAATLAAKVKAANDARQKRLQAEAAASLRSIDLGRFEQLVRRGHRTLGEYDALLESLGFDDAARAGMVELLQLKIADDTAARDVRASVADASSPQGLTLEQLRRAVVAGNATIDDFQRFLLQANYTTDAQIVLLAELRDDVAAADAARRRRLETDGASGRAVLPLSRLRVAAQLGIVPPDEYGRRLAQAGYTADDVAIEMDLLLTEISQVQAARAKRDAAAAGAGDKGLTLAQLGAAVKLGVATIDDYRARAIALGLGAADVAIVVGVLEQELLVLTDAKSRRVQIAAQLVPEGVALADLEQQVIAGAITVADYQARLEALGVDPDDSDYLGALLMVQLEGAHG